MSLFELFFFCFQMSLTDWKYISSKTPGESKLGHENQMLKMELARAFMPVPITSNFNDDSIKIERASMVTPFSH